MKCALLALFCLSQVALASPAQEKFAAELCHHSVSRTDRSDCITTGAQRPNFYSAALHICHAADDQNRLACHERAVAVLSQSDSELSDESGKCQKELQPRSEMLSLCLKNALLSSGIRAEAKQAFAPKDFGIIYPDGYVPPPANRASR